MANVNRDGPYGFLQRSLCESSGKIFNHPEFPIN